MSTNAFRFEHPLKLVQFPPPLPNKIQQQSSLGNIFNLNNIRGNVERRLCGGNLDDQTLTLSGTNLSIEGGNTVDLSALRDGTEDADADPTNEIQTLSFNAATNELSIAGGNSITIPSGGTDADADPTNEIQTIAISGNELTLSNGGGSVTLPSGGGGGTDSQTLTFDPATNTLAISGGNSVVIPTRADADAYPTAAGPANKTGKNDIIDLFLKQHSTYKLNRRLCVAGGVARYFSFAFMILAIIDLNSKILYDLTTLPILIYVDSFSPPVIKIAFRSTMPLSL